MELSIKGMRMERFRRFLKHENRQSNISLPQIQPFSNSPSLLLNYFKIVLNFGYGLFLIPFRLKLVGTKHKLHVNRIQQVIYFSISHYELFPIPRNLPFVLLMYLLFYFCSAFALLFIFR